MVATLPTLLLVSGLLALNAVAGNRPGAGVTPARAARTPGAASSGGTPEVFRVGASTAPTPGSNIDSPRSTVVDADSSTPAAQDEDAAKSLPPPAPIVTQSTYACEQTSASGVAGGSSDGSPYATAIEQQVFDLINQERAQHGLPAYALSTCLTESATAHDALMAAGCGLSHQCPGEPPLGTRESEAGVSWTRAGENIGEGGPVAATEAAESQMALDLAESMYREQPPRDGHRLDILSTAFTGIGISVWVDQSGVLWLTEDFAG